MKRLSCLISALSLSVLAAPSSAAELIGDTVSCNQIGPGLFNCGPASAVVGSGTEFVAGFLPYEEYIYFDFTGSALEITGHDGGFSLGSTIITFQNLTTPFSFASLNFSTIAGFDASDVSLVDGLLTLNFIDTDWADGNGASIELATAASSGAVPEPAGWAMMVLGFMALGAMLRSDRRKQSLRYDFA